jgi:modulator of FtsH protease
MNDNFQTADYYGVPTAQERNRVVRNTYWLLAISMLPTVLGAWVGVTTGISYAISGVMGMILMLAGVFGFIYAIERTKESATGVYVLLGFTFFMGLMLSRMIAMVLGFKNGADLVMTAFAGTAGVFFVMASLATFIKRDLSGMGKWLMVGAVVLMVGSIINVFVGSSAGMMVISMLSMAIFSAFMLYDLKQVMDGGETNYISATLTLYLDIINVFVGSSAGMMVISMLSMAIFSAFMLYDLKQVMDGGETNYISATLTLYLDIINVFQSLLALLGIFGGERE